MLEKAVERHKKDNRERAERLSQSQVRRTNPHTHVDVAGIVLIVSTCTLRRAQSGLNDDMIECVCGRFLMKGGAAANHFRACAEVEHNMLIWLNFCCALWTAVAVVFAQW
jgi:hypothetical protein